MTLRELIGDIAKIAVVGDPDIAISGIQYDSRAIKGGNVFVAIRGLQADGHLFIRDALSRGAHAIVQEEDQHFDGVVTVQVPQSRQALAVLSSTFYGHPARMLRIIGITGTNGKTTVTYLVRSILQAAGLSTGLIGTIHYQVGGKTGQDPYHRTTPESLDLHRLFAAMVKSGQQAVVMEVSSHSLALDRTYGIPFKTGVFTNLSRDHLDFHKTPVAYFAAKSILFEQLDAHRNANAVINVDDSVASELIRRTKVPVLTYGFSEQASVRPLKVSSDASGSDTLVDTPDGQIQIHLRLRGRFNVHNALAAIAIGIANDIDLDTIRAGIEDVASVEGRFESVECGQDFLVLVDYAHSPDALEHVLRAAKELTTGKLISVFGCGGDRDPGKRPQMGKISAEIADCSIITSDNPRSEPPEAIIQQIVAGVPKEACYEVQPDRRSAIEMAIKRANQGDVVVIAGKGHETYQIVGEQTHHFDDREVARAALESLC